MKFTFKHGKLGNLKFPDGEHSLSRKRNLRKIDFFRFLYSLSSIIAAGYIVITVAGGYSRTNWYETDFMTALIITLCASILLSYAGNKKTRAVLLFFYSFLFSTITFWEISQAIIISTDDFYINKKYEVFSYIIIFIPLLVIFISSLFMSAKILLVGEDTKGSSGDTGDR